MKTLTGKGALKLLADVVQEHGGDHVYEQVPHDGMEVCAYWDVEGNCPSCLVGHVVHRFGVPTSFLLRNNIEVGISSLAGRLAGNADVEHRISREAVSVLLAAQASQDEGDHWGTALANAVQAYVDLED